MHSTLIDVTYLAVTGGTKNPVVVVIISIAIVVGAIFIVRSIVRSTRKK